MALARDWQTLITGFLAIAAAFIGGSYINKQIKLTRDLEADRRERELAAARAMLPLHLASMTTHVHANARSLKLLRRACVNNTLQTGAFTRDTFPPITSVPMQTVLFFEGMVLKGDGDERTRYAEILEKVQVADSRLADLRERHLDPDPDNVMHVSAANINTDILLLADIHARCSVLFPTARSPKLIYHPSGQDLRNSLRVMDFHDMKYPELFAEISRREGLEAKS